MCFLCVFIRHIIGPLIILESDERTDKSPMIIIWHTTPSIINKIFTNSHRIEANKERVNKPPRKKHVASSSNWIIRESEGFKIYLEGWFSVGMLCFYGNDDEWQRPTSTLWRLEHVRAQKYFERVTFN